MPDYEVRSVLVDERTDGGRARRRKVRRLAANWAELHRQEDAAEQSSPVYPLIGRLAFGVIILPAFAGLWHLTRGEPVGDLEWTALAVVAGALVLWNAPEWRADIRTWWARRRSKPRSTT